MFSGCLGAPLKGTLYILALPPGVIFMMNSLTGLSLLTLPYGFGEAGFLLGALIILGCRIISFMTATFMCD